MINSIILLLNRRKLLTMGIVKFKISSIQFLVFNSLGDILLAIMERCAQKLTNYWRERGLENKENSEFTYCRSRK